ncbi:hypothetical protein ES705_43593 [subsurface metagenome]
MLSGVTHHEANRHRIRVITLTSSSEAHYYDINAHFQVLRKRIMRKWPGAGFQYWKLRTSEGHGVLHILYVGPWIPQSWLSWNWDEIHNSRIVYIQEFQRRRKKLVSYLLSHYLPSHEGEHLYTRMSWSWGWVFRGFCGAWRYFWKLGPTMYEAIYEWNKLMRREDPYYYYKMKRGLLYEQTVLKKRGIMGTVVFD